MIMNGLTQQWADKFGLALAPLFEPKEWLRRAPMLCCSMAATAASPCR